MCMVQSVVLQVGPVQLFLLDHLSINVHLRAELGQDRISWHLLLNEFALLLPGMPTWRSELLRNGHAQRLCVLEQGVVPVH